MAQSILDIYNASQADLGTDKISYDAALSKKTPYSTDDNQKADDAILTAEKFGTARGGDIPSTPYSPTVNRG